MPRMSEGQAQTHISDRIAVDRADIAQAKAFALRYIDGLTEHEKDAGAGRVQVPELWRAFLSEMQVSAPWLPDVAAPGRPLYLNFDASDLEVRLAEIARACSLIVAMQEAASELVRVGVLSQRGQWSGWNGGTITYEYSGGRAGFGIPGLHSSFPEGVSRPLSHRTAAATPDAIHDADLFMMGLAPEELHTGVIQALRLAIACFRQDLYLPAVAMLTAAAEGMWAETGRALFEAAERLGEGASVKKLRDALVSSRASFAEKVAQIEAAYSRDIFERVWGMAGKRPADLRVVKLWTDVLRDSRNVLHWGVEPATANSYSKIATLMQSTPLHMQALAAIKRAAECGDKTK